MWGSMRDMLRDMSLKNSLLIKSYVDHGGALMIKVLIAAFMFYIVNHNELLVYFYSMRCVIVQFLPTWPPKVFLLQCVGTFASSSERVGKKLLNCVQFSFHLTDNSYSLTGTLLTLIRSYLVHVQERTSINIFFLGHRTELMDSAYWVTAKVQFKKSVLFFALYRFTSFFEVDIPS